MIDKQKTIAKAISKYEYVFPVYGKDSLNECFFCARGEYFFLFRTKDKKKRMMKAEISRSSVSFEGINRELLSSIYRTLNKPILIRSLFIKNGDSTQTNVPPDYVNKDFFTLIFKTLNQPILLRQNSEKKAELQHEAAQVA
jgi:predicted N-acyltransferase